MKKILYPLASLLMLNQGIAQEEKADTNRLNFGKIELIVVEHPDKFSHNHNDTIDASPSEEEAKKNEAHWAGLDLGVSVLMNNNYGTSFQNNPYWENDPAKSFNIGLNLMEHKFSIYRHFVGITTGLGFNFTQIGFKDNYVLTSTPDTIFAVMDTLFSYSKNKLKATYLQVPLLLEFNTSADSDKNFYFAAGVVGGVRLSSKIKREGEMDGKNFEQKVKGTYALNSFKCDATVRLGYRDWGAFATYGLIPLFEAGKTVQVHPFTVGLTHNF
jgi:hypothetical protein